MALIAFSSKCNSGFLRFKLRSYKFGILLDALGNIMTESSFKQLYVEFD